MKPVKVGLLGLGTVGGGTAVILKRNAEEISRRAGRGIEVDFIATLDADAATNLGIENVRLTDDAFAVVNDPDIDIVVELIGGYSPAKELVLQAIEKALASYEQMQYSKSLQFLLQASDSLIRLKTEQADRLRQKIALLITVIEREV